MHPIRRRKKRPNYGLRTVEVVRGSNGFGFTISGQQPCILSCIVSGSPAGQAGLRAGDFLISVNGMSVSKMTHESVVNLIGNCVGPIKLTIAENYYSGSSDEEFEYNRMVNSRKPKFLHKPRGRAYRNEYRTRCMQRDSLDSPLKKTVKMRESPERKPFINLNHDYANNCNQLSLEEDMIEYKAIVGYLGTIEMPKQLLPNSRLQTVCSCIRKLRQEKRSPTAILMTILPTCLTLKNASNNILAIYPTNRVVYISCNTEKDSRYFGLVTSAICENSNSKSDLNQSFNFKDQPNDQASCEIDVSNSCHVFVTDPKITDHNIHMSKADTFKITCTIDVTTGCCLEFPKNALYIVDLVQNLYRLQNTPEKNNLFLHDENMLVANSPQPSASSNSDSGIGFRDDCGNISDRILVVEFPKERTLPLLPTNKKRHLGIDISFFKFKSPDVPLNNTLGNNSKCNQVKSIELHHPNDLSKNLNYDEQVSSNYVLSNVKYGQMNCPNLSDVNSDSKNTNYVLNTDPEFLVSNVNFDQSVSYYKTQNEIKFCNSTYGDDQQCSNSHEKLNTNVEDSDNFERFNRPLNKHNCKIELDESICIIDECSVNSALNDLNVHSAVSNLSNKQLHKNNFEMIHDTNVNTSNLLPSMKYSEDKPKNADVDSGHCFLERAVDVPVDVFENISHKQSQESLFLHSLTEDNTEYKSSVDSLSIQSSKSFDLFKTPSSKYFASKKVSKRNLKVVRSCDNLVSDKYEKSMFDNNLISKDNAKQNYSCEELNANRDIASYSSLQDILVWDRKKNNSAQSEPDIRFQNENRKQHVSMFT